MNYEEHKRSATASFFRGLFSDLLWGALVGLIFFIIAALLAA